MKITAFRNGTVYADLHEERSVEVLVEPESYDATPYEEFEIGGIAWSLPLKMAEELTAQYLKKHGRVSL